MEYQKFCFQLVPQIPWMQPEVNKQKNPKILEIYKCKKNPQLNGDKTLHDFCSHMTFLPLSECLSVFSSYKATSHVGLGVHPTL